VAAEPRRASNILAAFGLALQTKQYMHQINTLKEYFAEKQTKQNPLATASQDCQPGRLGSTHTQPMPTQGLMNGSASTIKQGRCIQCWKLLFSVDGGIPASSAQRPDHAHGGLLAMKVANRRPGDNTNMFVDT
jgi:hypothetical protein